MLLRRALGRGRGSRPVHARLAPAVSRRRGGVRGARARARHEPLQYLLGGADFCGLALSVAPGCSSRGPRPRRSSTGRSPCSCPRPAATVLDLCTGSGAIAVRAGRAPAGLVGLGRRAASSPPRWRAGERRGLGLAGASGCVEGDLFDRSGRSRRRLTSSWPTRPISRRPVVPTLPVEVRDWEPRDALDGGPDGLDVIRRLLAAGPAGSRPAGRSARRDRPGAGPPPRCSGRPAVRRGTVHRDSGDTSGSSRPGGADAGATRHRGRRSAAREVRGQRGEERGLAAAWPRRSSRPRPVVRSRTSPTRRCRHDPALCGDLGAEVDQRDGRTGAGVRARPSRRRTSWSRPCGPPSSSWARSWPAPAGPRGRCPAAAPSGCGRSICT